MKSRNLYIIKKVKFLCILGAQICVERPTWLSNGGLPIMFTHFNCAYSLFGLVVLRSSRVLSVAMSFPMRIPF